jgi:hypothetical protein
VADFGLKEEEIRESFGRTSIATVSGSLSELLRRDTVFFDVTVVDPMIWG